MLWISGNANDIAIYFLHALTMCGNGLCCLLLMLEDYITYMYMYVYIYVDIFTIQPAESSVL